jgi:hypothetical protein
LCLATVTPLCQNWITGEINFSSHLRELGQILSLF